ncbi:type IV secretion system protein B10 [Aliiroseovarius sp. S2029]|uniref:TrbI/VirB10 family protein n=1 Tax=Aliiroseovarius sp. S2029 TaxID=2936988 RepID=UPI0020BE2596|nr:TrbI/VirB10 family protein [Aliiroseovarius sp. S2029]MCK8485299.1 type IV secretion system protein B10 [Aliiroseovarius sp. S2029]
MADPDLQKRLNTFSDDKKISRTSGLGVGALAIALGLGGAGVAYWLASSGHDIPSSLETSEVEPFQDGRPGGGRLEFPPDEAEERVNDALIAVEDALDVPESPAPEPSSEVLDEIARLREALAASQSERNAEIQAAVNDLREAFDAQTRALEAQIAERERQLTAIERENDAKLANLQALLEAEQAQRESLEAELQNNSLIADQELLEERRRQKEEQRRREAERDAAELLTAQIRSPAIVYADGRGATAAPSGPAGTGAPLDENEAYLQRAARPLEVEEATRMEFPDRTLAQGSVIQAALQTAINSDLPGNVVAVVSEPVPAFSGERILIPRGSRLFGQYRSGIEVNQKRILILWTRILTPDGTSMDIAAVGGDQLGRSGLTGLVDTKFDERFGGAALISIIGAAPSVAAEQARDEVRGEVLENIGEDLSDATSSVIADQVSIAPTIYVDQGASVTVLVDRDVVIY